MIPAILFIVGVLLYIGGAAYASFTTGKSQYQGGLTALAGVVLMASAVVVHQANARGLPHRPVNELTNWGQGRAPESNHCPSGTIRVDTDDGLFLECFRGTN